ncbi:TPA: hypothetical protein POA17_001377 [Escherichia coli]|nr:hypothetical protein [Escherichia coli]ELP2968291.1 hypothetical protein [Escherichia coli O105]EFB3418442.1 hypothetical protein [Escherichia coli]EFB4651954.1 hypothetical protein [Escherichia coli]EFD8920235.1 hypothetical protein [Escherichia coli]
MSLVRAFEPASTYGRASIDFTLFSQPLRNIEPILSALTVPLNTIDLIIDAAIDGHGLAYLPYDQVERAIKEKKLIRVLDKFTPDLPGYHLYYPHRRHAGSAFSLFIDRLKYKGAV